MPSEKARSKEDTWRPEELEKSLKEIHGERRRHRDRDANDREHHRKDETKGDERDRHRRHRSDRHEDHEDNRSRDPDAEYSSRHRSSDRTEKGNEIKGREERRRKDEEREERHRRKREERKSREDGDKLGREDEDRQRKHRNKDTHDGAENEKRHHNGDENNHSDRDRERRHGGRDAAHDRHKGDHDIERKKDGERHHRRDRDDRRKSDRDEEDRDRHRSKGKEEERERRHHKDGSERRNRDDDKNRSHRNDDKGRRRRDDERDRRHRGVDRERYHDKDRDSRRHDEDREKRRHGDDRERRRHEDEKKESHHRNDSERKRKDSSSRHRRDDDTDDQYESRRRHRDRREEKEEKRDRQKNERGERKHRDKRDRQDEEEDSPAVAVEKTDVNHEEQGGDDYEDDFEEYEEDFEEEEDGDSDSGKELNLPVTQSSSVRSTSALRRNWNADTAPLNEVDAVLQALDAENDRLMAESRRSYASDSTELSDERFRSSQTLSKQRTFINFVSAKQRTISDKASSKTRRRGHDLLQMIDLDVASYDMFDLPPVKEYDLYIRNFGRSDTKQVYVQTNEDNMDREIQTDDVEYRTKWSQHPAEESRGCGQGDGGKEEEELTLHSVVSDDTGRLGRFIQQAGQVISLLLEEEDSKEEGKVMTQSNLRVSEGYKQLVRPALLHGRSVVETRFSQNSPDLLLTLLSASEHKEQPSDSISHNLGIVCLWNINQPSSPQKILVCESLPRSCCFSPSSLLVFGGMVDGSVVLWDVRESPTAHHTVQSGDQEYCLRYPTYNTAGVIDDNHQSAVVTIATTLPAVDRSNNSSSVSGDTGSGESYQIVSVDETGSVSLWVVAEIPVVDIAGSESDLGLSPGGRVKLLKSSSLILENPVKDPRLRTGLRVTCLQLNPGDPNQFVVGTDSGLIIHGVRFGRKPLPRAYIDLTESPLDVVSVDYSPFHKPCFLAGCDDGTVRLYHSSNEKPLMTWLPREPGAGVLTVQWSHSRPGVFFILYSNSTLAVYDLVETDTRPAAFDQIQTGRAVGLSLSPAQGKHPHLILTLDSGETEIHTIADVFVKQQPFEEDFLTSYLDRF